MTLTRLAGLAGTTAALACALPLALTSGATPSPTAQDAGEEAAGMQAMMEKMMRYGAPGPQHAWLERFLGEWETEMVVSMPGAKPEKGRSTTTWLLDGRWIQTRGTGAMMGMPYEAVTTMGYDNFKMSFVATTVSSLDTAMNRVEGDLAPAGDTLILYGTIDEYLTGEHDKMTKTIYRFLSDDEYVMEVHDLAIGEENTKVVEVRFQRAS